jgi:ubiquinone/menaquinone biosynthesis C-methylase UbiE
MQRFADEFRPTPATTILDIGGTPFNWRLIEVPARVVLLNVIVPPDDGTLPENVSWAEGDGCDLPYRDAEFDICFSNSTIEHLHSFENQQRFAAEVGRVSRSYYVQTPARSFPLEPHWLGFFVHWLPLAWQKRIVRRFTFYGLVMKPTAAQIDALLDEYRLLSYRELRELFPDAEIRRERFMLLTKSYVAVRRGPAHEGALTGRS